MPDMQGTDHGSSDSIHDLPYKDKPHTQAVDIQVRLFHVILLVVTLLIHEAGIIWWASSVSFSISKMIDSDDVRKIIDRDAPFVHAEKTIKGDIRENGRNIDRLQLRMREEEKTNAQILAKLEALLDRIPPR